MSTYDLSQESELIVKSRKAAYCARRLDGADLTHQDMEDLIQTAALAYWKHQRRPTRSLLLRLRLASRRELLLPADSRPQPPQSSFPGCPLARRW